MATVRSTWATSPIVLNGVLSGPEWSGAGVMPVPAGFLVVKNDNNFLYIALDLVGDRGADPGVGDYFWFSVDNDRNRAITPNRDVNYGIYPTLPIRIARQYYLGPGAWTGILGTPSPAAARNGFGPSPRSAVPHRIWEMRLPLNEIGISSLGTDPFPVVRCGLRVASTTPGFTFDSPAGFFTSFLNLHTILLARTPPIPPGLAGPVLGSVGLIPATQITGGYATTAPSYFVHVDETAFAGTLNIIGNRTKMQNLWAAGARKYRILHRAGTSAPFTPLLQSWQNYRSTGPTTDVLESFTWDAENKYSMLDSTADYSIDDLLIQWNTVGEIGIHELRAEFFSTGGTEVPSSPDPSMPQTLRLMIDNNLPLVEIVQVMHNGVPVSACAMETMTSATDGVRIMITANDLEGHLNDVTLRALWGHGASEIVYSDAYPAHRTPSHLWNGFTSLSVPAGEWVPPVTCAYQFRLEVHPRVTNGYSYVGGVEDTYHVTLIKPGKSIAPVITRLHEAPLPYGQASRGVPPEPGTEPKKLGSDTFGSS